MSNLTEHLATSVPGEMADVIDGVCSAITKAHGMNLIQNAEYRAYVMKLKNAKIEAQAGLITHDQYLTLLLDVPASALVAAQDFGFEETTLKGKINVNAHHKKTTDVDLKVKSDTTIGTGGLTSLFSKAKTHITTDLNTDFKDEDDNSYAAQWEIEMKMKRLPAPPIFMEVIKLIKDLLTDAATMNKAVIKNQLTQLAEQVTNSDAPKSLPEDKGDESSDDSGDSEGESEDS